MLLTIKDIVKKYWKYILCFCLGIFLACLVPTTPMSRLLKRGYKFITKKETEIQTLKDNNNHLKGEIEILKRDKEFIEKRISIMEQQKDSLDREVKKQDEILEKINDKYEEIDRITNFNDKQLNEFFANYGRRYNTR